jgi:hypothetical protein
MDLEASRDEVLAQKDQANTVFLLHGYGQGIVGFPIGKIGDVILAHLPGQILARGGIETGSTPAESRNP